MQKFIFSNSGKISKILCSLVHVDDIIANRNSYILTIAENYIKKDVAGQVDSIRNDIDPSSNL